MFKVYKMGLCKGVVINMSKNRNFLDICYAKKDYICFGINISFSTDAPIHIGIGIFKLDIYIQIFGEND